MSDIPSESAAPLRTPLHTLHEELGARIVTFAGYAMPLQYPTGIIKEHVQTRTAASLFDVSHMGQIRVTGRGAAAALEALMPIDVIGLPEGRQRYGLLTNERGGIIDDLMVAHLGDGLLLVVNAANKARDAEYLRERLEPACSVEVLSDRSLLALQGPAAARVLAERAPETESMAFMDARRTDVAGIDCHVSRSGYTGEDGFEISVPADAAEALARDLLSEREVAAAGLGARDSLRLEADLCLHGSDIDATTTPVEAGLTWALPKVRRPCGARAGGYPGAETIAAQLEHGTERKRAGLLPQTRAPVRAGTKLVDADGERTGIVTSGGYGATIRGPLAMGYVATALAEPGTQLMAMVRNETVRIDVVRMPVVAHRYVRRIR